VHHVIPHLHYLADYCWPNCHPAPSSGVGTTPAGETGDAALGAAAFLIVAIILKQILFGGGRK
jgi:hypothetical protein